MKAVFAVILVAVLFAVTVGILQSRFEQKQQRAVAIIGQLQSELAITRSRAKEDEKHLAEAEIVRRNEQMACDASLASLRTTIKHMQEEDDRVPRTPIFGKK